MSKTALAEQDSAYNLQSLPDICSPSQVLKVLPISKSLLYVAMENGDIPAKRLRGRWLIYKSRLIAWLEQPDNPKSQERLSA